MQFHVRQECIIQTVHTRTQGASNTVVVKYLSSNRKLDTPNDLICSAQLGGTAAVALTHTLPQPSPVQASSSTWMQRESGAWMIKAVCGVFCFCRLIRVRPKLKLTCFLHVLWSSVKVSRVAARVSRSGFKRRDYTRGSCEHRVVGWQPAVVGGVFFCLFKLWISPCFGSWDQVGVNKSCSDLMTLHWFPCSLNIFFTLYESAQSATMTFFKWITHKYYAGFFQ